MTRLAPAIVGALIVAVTAGCGTSVVTPDPILSGVTTTGGGGIAAPAPTTPVGTTETTVSPSSLPAPAYTMTTIGDCRDDGTIVSPPDDPDLLCRYGRLILGHALPDGRGRLGVITRALTVGDTVTIDGHLYTVTDTQSLEKGTYDPEAVGPALIACDIHGGYSTDGHSLRNLVVTLHPL